MTYTKNELISMPTINDDDYNNHPYGELKEYTDKKRVWFDPATDEVVVEVFDYAFGEGWQVEESYIAE